MSTPRLLALDDDAASAELVVRIAERCGYDAFATSDPRGVIGLAKALSPQVMAIDIAMPHLDAIEVFRLLAGLAFKGQVIVISGQDVSVLELTQKAAVAIGLAKPLLHQKPLQIPRLREDLTTLFQVAAD